MLDGSQGVAETGRAESGTTMGGSCSEGYCDRTLRLEKELTRWKREESALRDLERRYLAILDSPLLIFMVLFKGRVLFMNRRGEEFFGFSLRERPRFKLTDYVAPGFVTSVDEVFSPDEGEAPSTRRLAFPIHSEDGRERLIECAFVPGFYQGMAVHFTTGHELVPPRKEATEDSFADLLLREREDLLLCGMDGEGAVVLMTEGFRKESSTIWGVAASEGERLPGLRQSMSPSDPFRLAFDRACAGEPATTSIEAGEALYRCAFTPVYTRNGEFKGVSLLLSDTGEQCRLERELYNEARSFDRLFSSSSDMMLVTKIVDGRALRCSSSLLSWTGFPEDELPALTDMDLGIFADQGHRDDLVEAIRGGNRMDTFEAEIRMASGDVARASVLVSTITTGGAESLLYVLHEIPEEPETPEAEEDAERFEIPEVPEERAAVATSDPSDAGFFGSLFSESEDALLCALDADGAVVFMTKGFEFASTALWGGHPGPGESFVDMLPDDVQGELFRTALDRAGRGEATRVGQESGELYLFFSVAPLHGDDGRVSGFTIVAADRTSHRELERERRAEEEKFRRLFMSSSEMMMISLEDGRVLQCNKAFLKKLGRADSMVAGRAPEDLGLVMDAESKRSLLRRLDEEGAIRDGRILLRSSKGESIPVSFSVDRIVSEGRPCLLYIFSTMSREIPPELHAPPDVEGLREPAIGAEPEQETGVPERLGFERLLNAEIDLTRRYKRNMSLILIYLDGIEGVTADLGTEAKEALLNEFAASVKGRIRITDYLGRWRADSLAVLTQMSGPLAFQEAEGIRELVAGMRLLKDGRMTASIGVAEFRRTMKVEEFTGRAEKALEDAKKAGGDRTILAPFVP